MIVCFLGHPVHIFNTFIDKVQKDYDFLNLGVEVTKFLIEKLSAILNSQNLVYNISLHFCKNGLEIISSFFLVKSNRKMKKLFSENLQNKSAVKRMRNKYPALKRKNKF